MQIGFDSVWASPTTLHLRVLVWVRPNYGAVKENISIPLADIEGLENAIAVALANASADPGDDDQAVLWGMDEALSDVDTAAEAAQRLVNEQLPR